MSISIYIAKKEREIDYSESAYPAAVILEYFEDALEVTRKQRDYVDTLIIDDYIQSYDNYSNYSLQSKKDIETFLKKSKLFWMAVNNSYTLSTLNKWKKDAGWDKTLLEELETLIKMLNMALMKKLTVFVYTS
ncbi:MAG: hypothetical protein ABF709_09460 [Leuconostoc pseudomesenteroides]|uniref:hypothetical protein n=1 Tax=Leuconostoc pseudomesenteroides TaxID=33968 RepID=UPI00301CB6FF